MTSVSMPPEAQDDYSAALDVLRTEGRFRQCRWIEPLGDGSMAVQLDGRRVINFSSNDYLGLSQDSRLKDAAIDAILRYGTGSAAARLISGTNSVALALEQAVATFKHTEAALVFNSGYQANVAILQAILDAGDWVFCDKLNHASLVDGCLLSGARWTRYRHLDLTHLESKLQKAPPQARKWIVTDTVFSMDGDYPDLKALVGLAERYHARILVDEAHATGIYGDTHRSGLCEAMGVGHRVTLQMGTFSKALGGSGAYVAGSQVLIDTLINKARGFIYSTAQSPPVLAAALRAIQLVQEDPEPTKRLWNNIASFETAIQQRELDSWIPRPLKSPIIPVLIGESEDTITLSQALLEKGYYVQGIRPPTVPPGTARLRIALSARHTTAEIEALVQTLAQLRDRFQPLTP